MDYDKDEKRLYEMLKSLGVPEDKLQYGTMQIMSWSDCLKNIAVNKETERIMNIQVKVMGDDPYSIMPATYTKTIKELYGDLICPKEQL